MVCAFICTAIEAKSTEEEEEEEVAEKRIARLLATQRATTRRLTSVCLSLWWPLGASDITTFAQFLPWHHVTAVRDEPTPRGFEGEVFYYFSLNKYKDNGTLPNNNNNNNH